ncbi:MAG: helix-turn-helix domain-containing protein [Eubacterium sp.]
MKFDEKLNNYISQLNCSAKELAEASGLSQAVISRYKNGQRTPTTENAEKLAKGIAMLADKKGISLTKAQVISQLKGSLSSNDICSEILVKNLNTIMSALDINASELARAINYDASYLSRIRSGQRNISEPFEFASKTAFYIAKRYTNTEHREIIRELAGEGEDTKLLIEGWLCNNLCDNKEEASNYISDFLEKMNDFNLDEYIEAIHFNDIKVPTFPINFQTAKNYYGIEGMRRGELNFMRSAILSKSKEDIFMHNEMPMADMAEDLDFNKKWMMSIAMLLKKGVHLNIIHNLDRPWNELMLGLEAWIPIYMTGQVSPYYIKSTEKGIFRHINYTSGTAALSGECVDGKHTEGKYYLTKVHEEVAYYQNQAKNILKKATPLMEIYTQEKEKQFYTFLEKELDGAEKSDFIQAEAAKAFSNIEILVNPGKWAIVSKEKAPKIHFVIRHPKLVSAIEQFTPPVIEKHN